MSGNTIRDSHAGKFASARKGSLNNDEIRTAFDLKAKGRSVQHIAKYFGRSMQDIADLFAQVEASAGPEVKPVAPPPTKMGRPVYFWTDQKLSDLRLLYIDANLSAEATADIIGCTAEAVSQKASRLGLTKGGKKPVKAEKPKGQRGGSRLYRPHSATGAAA